MSKLEVLVRVDGKKEVVIAALESDEEMRYNALQIAQLTALASTVAGRRCGERGYPDMFPTRPEDVEHVGDHFVKKLYE
jgi:hypothetical protein